MPDRYRVHLAGRLNPHRTVCGRNIMLVVFVVGATERVNCAGCRRWIERQAKREKEAVSG